MEVAYDQRNYSASIWPHRQRQCARVRYGSVIGIRPEMAEEYEELHRNVPRAVLQTIADCDIVNYSIFRYQEQSR